MRRFTAISLALASSAFLAACSGSASSSAGPQQTASTSIVAVSPTGGANGVAVTAVITITFDHAVMLGMERYLSLHQDALTGPTVAGEVTRSIDGTRLTFTPAAPLRARTTYVVHVGGGMVDDAGHAVDYGRCASLGGRSASGSMMGGGMMSGAEMGAGWKGRDGAYGMLFKFATG